MKVPRILLIALQHLYRCLPKRYVIVHGFYGAGNVGDEAILAATLDAIRESGAEPFVFAWKPERVRADFDVPSLNPHHARKVAVWYVLLQSHAYLLGGGGLIKDFGGSPRSLGRWIDLLDAARRLGVRTMTWSVGVENLFYPESRARVREVLEHVDVVTVRDVCSAERLCEVGVKRNVIVTADPVPFLARTWRSRRHINRGLRIAVCVREWYSSKRELEDPEAFGRCLDALAEALDHVLEHHGASVTFVPFRTVEGDDDREVGRAVMQRMRNMATLIETADPSVDETLYQVAEADLVIAMRLHAAVMASSMGIPTLALAYMPKVRDYMSEIQQERFCLSMDEVTADRLITQVELLIAESEALSVDLMQRTDELADAFVQNGRLLQGLIEEGQLDAKKNVKSQRVHD